MAPDDFAAAVAPLFEGAPDYVRRLADARPFESEDGLFDRHAASPARCRSRSRSSC